MEEENLLPKPQTDLTLPEKEIPAHVESTEAPIIDGDVKEKSKSKIILLLLVGILILSGIMGAFYVWKNKSTKVTPAPVVSQSPTPSISSPINLNPGTGELYGDIKIRMKEVIK